MADETGRIEGAARERGAPAGEWLLTAGLVLALSVMGGLSWYFHLGDSLTVDATQLSKIPLQVDRWRGRDVPMQGAVEEMLDADYNLQRAYIHPVGDLVWLYVGYYGTDRGGRPEHTPWVCYPSNGWNIVSREVVRVDDDDRRVNEIVVEKDGEHRLVHFWYQSYRRSGMLGGFDQAYERLLSRFLDGRADGSLIRLSTPLDRSGEKRSARQRLISFGREIEPLLGANWPRETSVTS